MLKRHSILQINLYEKKVIFFLLLSFFVACGPQKKKEKLKNPLTILFPSPAGKLTAFFSPDTKAKSLEILESDFVVLESKLFVEWSEWRKEEFYEASCPVRMQSKCEGEKIYIQTNVLKNIDEIKNLFYAFKPTQDIFLICLNEKKEEAKSTRDWFLDSKKPVNLEIDTLLYLILRKKNPLDMLGLLQELILVEYSQRNPNYTDKTRIDLILKKYPGLDTPENRIILRYYKPALDELARKIEKQILDGFPVQSINYKQLVNRFNSLQKIPFLSEKVFFEILNNSIFQEDKLFYSNASNKKAIQKKILKLVSPKDLENENLYVDWKWEFKLGNSNEIFSEIWNKKEKIVSKEKLTLKSIEASLEKEILSFQVITDKKEFKLILVEPNPYLSEMNLFLQKKEQIPEGRYKELFTNLTYYNASFQSVLKEGRGGFGEETGIFEYTLSSAEGYEYWVMLEIFRMHPSVNRKMDYSGEFVSSFCDTPVRWRQPKGELYLGCEKEICDGRCKVELVEEICFSEKEKGGKETLKIRLPPSDWKAETPRLQFEFQSAKPECNRILNEILNSPSAN